MAAAFRREDQTVEELDEFIGRQVAIGPGYILVVVSQAAFGRLAQISLLLG